MIRLNDFSPLSAEVERIEVTTNPRNDEIESRVFLRTPWVWKCSRGMAGIRVGQVLAGFEHSVRNRHVGMDNPKKPPGTRSRTLNPKVAEDKKSQQGRHMG